MRAVPRYRGGTARDGGGAGRRDAVTVTRRIALAAVAIALLAAVLWLRLDRGPGDAPPEASPRIVFAEYGATADAIYVADPGALADRERVASAPHAAGWAITPAPLMAGPLAAFSALPPEADPRSGAPAVLWLLDVRDGSLTRLAGDADPLVPPVFGEGGAALLYRRTVAEDAQELVRVDLATRARRPLHRAVTRFGVYPVALDGGAALYFELSTGGTDLYRVREGGRPEHVAHASDHAARDWRLSPDGAALAYLAPEVSAERVVHRARVVGVRADGEGRAPPPDAPGAVLASQFSPVWTPGGDGLTVGVEAFPDARAAAVTIALGGGDASGGGAALPAPERGFDAPLGWSPDGRWLATRSFDGRDASEPGRETLVVISPDDGARAAIEADAELIWIGWLADADGDG